jgi:thiol:disulfide interchange protein DsbD
MLPMLPILSSVVFGTTKHHQLSRKKTTTLAFTYVLGMACAFSLAGMATAWFGSGIASYLQSPIVSIAFGLLMIILAGSLMGWYELQLPTTWHNQVNHWMGKHQGGNVFGVFMLGALSSLIASPCVTAPLAGVLTFIAQSGQVSVGGLVLFVMACGMGTPLLLFAIGAKRAVPKAGSWMVRVQRLLAVLLIAYAAWMIYPAATRMFHTAQVSDTKKIAGLEYQVVTSLEQLQQSVDEATRNHQPSFISFYADWCVSCKEIEITTLSSEEVQTLLKNYKRIEVDVTELGDNQKRLLQKYQLFGPPAFIFIDENGNEKTQQRTVGLIHANQLVEKLR